MLPLELWHLTNLQYMDSGHNGFASSLATEVGHLSHLERLHANDATLSGIIPKTLGLCTSLSSNILGGSIPTHFINLPDLNSMLFCENRLSGTVPESGCLRSLVMSSIVVPSPTTFLAVLDVATITRTQLLRVSRMMELLAFLFVGKL